MSTPLPPPFWSPTASTTQIPFTPTPTTPSHFPLPLIDLF